MRKFRNKKKTVILTSTSGHCVRVGKDWISVPDILVSQARAAGCEEKKNKADNEEQQPESNEEDSPFWVEPADKGEQQESADNADIQNAIKEINNLVESGETKYGKMSLLNAQGIPNAKVISSMIGRQVKKDEVVAALEAMDE